MFVTHVANFRRFWYPLAFVEDLDSGPLSRKLLDVDLVLWSNGDGGAAAAVDLCPHRSSKLSIGTVKDGCIVCPYHGWQFEADGPAVHIPQLEEGVPIPPRARLETAHCTVRYGVVWVALEDPVGGIPDLEVFDDPDYRCIRQFDEVWAAASPRLVDNSFDDAHVAYVHQGTIGSPDNARIPLPEVEMTAEGMVMNSVLEVENQLAVAQRTNLMEEERTLRITESRLVGPFLRVMSIVYPTGLNHVLVTGMAPVSDTHLRLVQWAIRNDTEEEVAAADVVAFDRAVTLEDKWLLEHTSPDYELDLTQNVHIKIDRGTIAVRKLYGEIVDGTWPGLALRQPALSVE